MCANLLGNVQSAYSVRHRPGRRLGLRDFAPLRRAGDQYDCFSPIEMSCPGGQTMFHDECIGPRTEVIESRLFDTLSRQVFRNGDVGKTLVVKIDVEGAELASLLATSDAVLNRLISWRWSSTAPTDSFLNSCGS